MIVTVALALAFLAVATLVGGLLVSMLSVSSEDDPFFRATAPLLGVAVLLALLDVVELWVPLHECAWIVPPLAAVALVAAVRRARRDGALGLAPRDVVVPLLGAAVGALPTAFVGRATVAALTNDDATYYLVAAERLVARPWLEHLGNGTGEFCLSELVVHAWLWRTGIANLVGTVIAVAHVDGTVAIAVVTATLMTLVAQSGVALGLALGAPRFGWQRSIAGAAFVLSAAPIFLGWQHLLGQLFAFAFFPLALASLARASLRGGGRRIAVAGLLFGAAMNAFADAAPVMFVGVVSVSCLGGLDAIGRRLARIACSGVVAGVVFPLTFWRAAWAAYGTLAVRAEGESRGLFPQRGWLNRSPLDDLATLFGVDPWPPWPAPWPPPVMSVMEYGAVIVSLVVVTVAVVRERRRPGLLAAVLTTAAFGAFVMLCVSNRYLRAKCLLLEASLVVPAVIAAAFVLPRARIVVAAFALWAAADLLAVSQLARPTAFHVVDEPDHDHLAPALARLPPGSLLALDGFGAPADVVHDAHRAMRAAHHAGIAPIQPGFDGGFFKPICRDPTFEPIPAVGWALQRAGTETLTGGEVVETFGRFTLRKVDLSSDGAAVGAWAPTYGWLRAETEPDGSVFRWGESAAAGVLRIVTPDRCGHLSAEVRSVDGTGSFSVVIDQSPAATGTLTPRWSAFRTAPFSVQDEVLVELHAFVAASDPAHVVAVRKVTFTPESSCLGVVTKQGQGAKSDLFPDALRDTNEYVVAPAIGVRCGIVTATIEAPAAGGVVIAAGTDRKYSAVSAGRPEASSLTIDFRRVSTFAVRRVPDAEPTADWQIAALRVRPAPCQNDSR